MSILLLFYYALLGVFAITSVVAAPHPVKQAALMPVEPGKNIGSLLGAHELLLGKTWHRVKRGTTVHWPETEDLDDVINFKMIDGHLKVAHIRLSRVIYTISPSWERRCLVVDDMARVQAFFASDDNYVLVDSLPRESFLLGYWINVAEFTKVGLFLRRFGNCLIRPYRKGVRPSLTLTR